MADYIVTTEELVEIADKIREKNGGSETFAFSDFVNEIDKISGGGGKILNTADFIFGKIMKLEDDNSEL